MNRALPLLAALLLGAPALSADNADGPGEIAADKAKAMVEYRHAFYEGLGKHMKMSAMIIKGEVDRPGDLAKHARALHEASTSIPHLFPKGTEPSAHKSEAKPEIWTDWKGFMEKQKAFETASAKFVEVAEQGDMKAAGAQFRKVGMSCGGCHDGYRVDED